MRRVLRSARRRAQAIEGREGEGAATAAQPRRATELWRSAAGAAAERVAAVGERGTQRRSGSAPAHRGPQSGGGNRVPHTAYTRWGPCAQGEPSFGRGWRDFFFRTRNRGGPGCDCRSNDVGTPTSFEQCLCSNDGCSNDDQAYHSNDGLHRSNDELRCAQLWISKACVWPQMAPPAYYTIQPLVRQPNKPQQRPFSHMSSPMRPRAPRQCDSTPLCGRWPASQAPQPALHGNPASRATGNRAPGPSPTPLLPAAAAASPAGRQKGRG